MDTTPISAERAEPPGTDDIFMHDHKAAMKICDENGFEPGSIYPDAAFQRIEGGQEHVFAGVAKLLKGERIPFTMSVNGKVEITYGGLDPLTPEELKKRIAIDRTALFVWEAAHGLIMDFDGAVRKERAKLQFPEAQRLLQTDEKAVRRS